MRKVIVIAGREYKAAVRTKSFLVSLFLMPVLMGSSIAIQMIAKKIEDAGERRFAVIDRTPGQHLAEALKDGAERRNLTEIFDSDHPEIQVRPRYLMEPVEPSAPTQAAMDEQRFEL